MAAAEFELGDAGDDGHEDGGEEGADVYDEHLFLEGPGEGEEEKDSEGEEDVAANGAAGLLLLGCEGGQ
jgi:hypothetical protein